MFFKKNKFQDISSIPFRWLDKDFSKISPRFFTKTSTVAGFLFLAVFLYICFQVYVPVNPFSHETITYVVQKGLGDEDIAGDLQKLGIIRSSDFFRFYVVLSFQHSMLQAGKYEFSPRMSTYAVAKRLAQGDVVKNRAIILEGWDMKDISGYLESKEVCKKGEFLSLAKNDYTLQFPFLKGRPKGVGLEGYLYPDTYELADGETCEGVLKKMLLNFEDKVVQGLADKLAAQKKPLFDIVTMASIIEKEVPLYDDKKIVSGVLWKRISAGMPLQVDCTINYVTGKSDAAVAIKDTKVDSPYNTYLYKGLPKGPISSPGMESILAAMNPVKTEYWFYLSSFNGKTIFSKTLDEHNAAKAIYLK